jgi:hypothetical protein
MPHQRITRRAIGALAGLCLTCPATTAAEPPAAVRTLQLPPELLASLDARVQRAIEEASWLEELPLDDVAPGFLFQAE